MNRDEFMELVYETFADEPDNVLANGIIEAADAYAEHEKAQLSQEGTTKDAISRQMAIDTVDSETVSTNPEHFKSSEKFIKFMDDDDIASFGRWQWANGFNTALVASKVQLEKLPSAQPEPSIPLSWIEKYIEWLQSFDNEFANLEAAHISVMVKKWRDEQNETD